MMPAVDPKGLSDFLPGYEASYRGGIGAPRNTPRGIIDKLNLEINPRSPTRRLKRGLQTWAGRHWSARPPILESWLRKKPKNGPR
jgi:hypothetical protein